MRGKCVGHCAHVAVLATIGLALGESAQAAPIAPLALPGGGANVLAGGNASGTYGSRNDHVQGGGIYEVFTQTTDGDVNQSISTGTGGPTYIALFNTPAHGYTGSADTLTSYGAMNLIRIYARDTGASNPWIQLPTSVEIRGGAFTGNNGDSNAVVPTSFPTVYATVSSPTWTASGLATNQYYTDVAVNIPANTINSMMFDFGTPLGGGGQLFSEFQGTLVPEPATLGLLALGGAMAMLRRRRQA
jgi:hypothetical protein